MASSSQNDLCADPQLLTELGEFNQWLQSMHAAQSLLTENRIPCDGARADETPGLDGLPVGLAKTGLGLRRPEKKENPLLSLKGETLGSCGRFLLQRLLEVLPLRSQYMGGGNVRSIFPLPTSRDVLEKEFPDLNVDETVWLACVCVSLNSVWGGPITCSVAPNFTQMMCLDGLVSQVRRFCGLKVPMEGLDWDELFKVKSVDYQGEDR